MRQFTKIKTPQRSMLVTAALLARPERRGQQNAGVVALVCIGRELIIVFCADATEYVHWRELKSVEGLCFGT